MHLTPVNRQLLNTVEFVYSKDKIICTNQYTSNTVPVSSSGTQNYSSARNAERPSPEYWCRLVNLAHASTRLIELYLQFGCGSLRCRSCDARTTLKFENRSTLYYDFRTSNGGQLSGLLINTVKAFFFRTDLYKCSESSGRLYIRT